MLTKKALNQNNELALNTDTLPNYVSPFPVGTRISQLFGERPSFYKPLGFLGHPGIDYAVVFGTIVRACQWGLVLEIGNDPKGWGKYIKIQHGNLISLYAHLSEVLVTEDCYVTRGEIIASSGNSGLSSGPHTHFGLNDPRLYKNGYKGYIDPVPILDFEGNIMRDKLKKIEAEIAQIKKDGYKPESLFTHVKYIEQILAGEK